MELPTFGLEPQEHHAKPGRARPSEPRTATVVGGGLAGVVAAATLAERGVSVTLLEREPYLGGRVGGWPDRLGDGTRFQMERGFHAFFRQYYNLRAFLQRIDPELDGLLPLTDYPLLGPGGRSESFADLPVRPPYNLAALVWRTPSLRLADLVRVDGLAALEMLRYCEKRTFERFDEVPASDFLDSLRFPPEARRMLFDVFAHSFFNPQEEMSAAEMLKMFHFYFTGNPDGLIFDVLRAPFGAGLWDPIRRHLEALGVRIMLDAEVASVSRSGPRWRVRLARSNGKTAPLPADGLVLAVTVPALQRIVAGSEDLDAIGWRRDISKLRLTRPFAVWRLWLDRRAIRDRAPFAGTAGLGIIDNISLYERFQDDGRRWNARHGGSVVELHACAVPEDRDEESIRRELWSRLMELYPELAGAKRLDERFLLRRDCPGFEMGAYRRRPRPDTPMPGVGLAGDFVKLPIAAALMEGAVVSGTLAANYVLSGWGVQGAMIRSVPTTGMLCRVARPLCE